MEDYFPYLLFQRHIQANHAWPDLRQRMPSFARRSTHWQVWHSKMSSLDFAPGLSSLLTIGRKLGQSKSSLRIMPGQKHLSHSQPDGHRDPPRNPRLNQLSERSAVCQRRLIASRACLLAAIMERSAAVRTPEERLPGDQPRPPWPSASAVVSRTRASVSRGTGLSSGSGRPSPQRGQYDLMLGSCCGFLQEEECT